MSIRRLVLVLAIGLLAVATLASAAPSGVKRSLAISPAPAFTGAQLAQNPGDNWITTGGNIMSWHYSTLNQITPSNVSTMKLAWTTHLNGQCATATACGGEGNAVVYDGVMYISTGNDAVFALDASNGNQLWTYVPTPPPPDPSTTRTVTNLNGVNRGVALGEGRIYVGQNDGKLVALDQMTGGIVWDVQAAPWQQSYKITAAPVYYNGEVIIGMSGGDSGNRDFVAAYDANNGDLNWIWYVVPGPGQPGFNTWGFKSTWHWGGGAIFDTPIVDPTTNQVFVGTGNPEPWNSRPKGSELYVDSIVSLDASTGKLQWAYQTVHHDIWDDDIPDPGVIVTGTWRDYKIIKPGTWVDDPSKGWSGSHAVGQKIQYIGKPKAHRAVVYPSKMGFTFILDEKTGKPLIPTPEMKVQDPNNAQAAQMNLWPTQPIPVGDYWAAQCVLPTQWTQAGPDAKPVVHGCTYTPYNMSQFVAVPHDQGEWMPAAYNPANHTVNICIIDNRAWAFQAIPPADVLSVAKPGAGATGILSTHGTKEGYSGRLISQNVLTNKTTWSKQWPDWCYSGTLTTASGLLFVGHNDGSLEAYNATNGTSLWRGQTFPSSADAPSVTYTANGKQYVSVLAAGNNHENDPRGDLVETYALP